MSTKPDKRATLRIRLDEDGSMLAMIDKLGEIYGDRKAVLELLLETHPVFIDWLERVGKCFRCGQFVPLDSKEPGRTIAFHRVKPQPPEFFRPECGGATHRQEVNRRTELTMRCVEIQHHIRTFPPEWI